MQVQSPGWEDPLEEEMATRSSILVWRIPWTEEPGELQSMGSLKRLSMHAYIYICVCSVVQSCLTLCGLHANPMDCSLPDSSVHGIFQGRMLEWVAISSSRGAS